MPHKIKFCKRKRKNACLVDQIHSHFRSPTKNLVRRLDRSDEAQRHHQMPGRDEGLLVGGGDTGAGGAVSITAGATSANTVAGGAVTVTGGIVD